jgi:hypothetical protein
VATVDQLPESNDLKSFKCGLESHQWHFVYFSNTFQENPVEELISSLFALKKSMDKLDKAKQEAEPYRYHSFFNEEEEIEDNKRRFERALNGVIDARIRSTNFSGEPT